MIVIVINSINLRSIFLDITKYIHHTCSYGSVVYERQNFDMYMGHHRERKTAILISGTHAHTHSHLFKQKNKMKQKQMESIPKNILRCSNSINK